MVTEPNVVIKYMITDDENYVANSNATKLTSDKKDAQLWSTFDSAYNVLQDASNRGNGLKQLGNKFKVKEVKTYEQEISADIRLDIEQIANFLDIVMYCSEHEETLLQQLSVIDKQLSDMEHFMEFTDLNVVDGYKIYKRFQFLRQQRREIKYRIKICKEINSQSIDPEVLRSLIKYFKTQRYIPRYIDFDKMV